MEKKMTAGQMTNNEKKNRHGAFVTSTRLTQAVFPITRTLFQVHDRDNPNVIGFVQINDSIRKPAAEMSPRRWIEPTKSRRIRTYFPDQSFDFTVASNAK